jgi:hypothetical protein
MIDPTQLRAAFEPPPDAHHAIARDGEAFIWQVSPHVVLKKAAGILSGPLIQCFVDYFNPILKPGARIRVFGDFAGITAYTAEARELATAFTNEHRSAVDSIHLLGASKYLALAFGSYGRDIGSDLVFVYSDRESFLHSLRQAMNEPPDRGEEALVGR